MDGEQEGVSYQNQIFGDINTRIKNIEEKQRILKNRLLLIGQNLIDVKENHEEKIMEIKKDIEIIKENVNRLVSFLEIASNDMGKFARKEDVEILAKQARMFQPFKKTKKD